VRIEKDRCELKTLFLGSYGFGNLGDELCLIEAMRSFPSSEVWAFSADPSHTAKRTIVRNFITARPELKTQSFDRVVLGGGGVGFWPSLRDSMHWMQTCQWTNPDVELFIHNIGVGSFNNEEWQKDEVAHNIFKSLKSFTVRDHVSRWMALEWNFEKGSPGITLYPETTLVPETFTLPNLGHRPIGFSITGQKSMLDALHTDRDRIRAFIKSLGDFTAVPIVSTFQDDNSEEDDVKGFKVFAEMFLTGRPIALQEMLDFGWWDNQLTPLRLKHVISKLDMLVSQRKHNVIHSIGCKVPFVGIFPDDDDSILRIMFSLRHLVPERSTFLALATGRYGR